MKKLTCPECSESNFQVVMAELRLWLVCLACGREMIIRPKEQTGVSVYAFTFEIVDN